MIQDLIQVPKNNKFRKTRSRLGQENPKIKLLFHNRLNIQPPLHDILNGFPNEMVVTLVQQYNVGERSTIILYSYIINRHTRPVVSHIQRIGCQPEKLILY